MTLVQSCKNELLSLLNVHGLGGAHTEALDCFTSVKLISEQCQVKTVKYALGCLMLSPQHYSNK